jgi:hypothetical protein
MLSVVMLSVVMLSVVMLSVVKLSVVMLSVVMLNVVMLSVVMLSVVMLSVVMLTAMAPMKLVCKICLDFQRKMRVEKSSCSIKIIIKLKASTDRCGILLISSLIRTISKYTFHCIRKHS